MTETIDSHPIPGTAKSGASTPGLLNRVAATVATLAYVTATLGGIWVASRLVAHHYIAGTTGSGTISNNQFNMLFVGALLASLSFVASAVLVVTRLVSYLFPKPPVQTFIFDHAWGHWVPVKDCEPIVFDNLSVTHDLV